MIGRVLYLYLRGQFIVLNIKRPLWRKGHWKCIGMGKPIIDDDNFLLLLLFFLARVGSVCTKPTSKNDGEQHISPPVITLAPVYHSSLSSKP